MAWAELTRHVEGWTAARYRGLGPDAPGEIAAQACAQIWERFNLARGGAAFEGFAQGRLLEAARRYQERTPQAADPTWDTCLAELRQRNSRHARMLELVEVERASLQEAADVLGMDPLAACAMLDRARAALVRCMERSQEKPEGGAASQAPTRRRSERGR